MKIKKAFTLLEILLVVAAIAILAGIVVLAINPSRQLATTRNAQRYMDVNTIQKAVYEYSINYNSLSGVVSTTPLEICRSGASSCAGLADLSFLTNNTAYLTSLPTDPQAASLNGTGYMIYLLPSGRPAVYSSLAELGQEISTSNKSFVCGNTLVDARDSQSYPTIQIGDQCWMAKNLNIGTRIDVAQNQGDYSGGIQKYCYNNNSADCLNYGGLYQWHVVAGKNQSCDTFDCAANPSNACCVASDTDICPSGWHMPTDAEWTILSQSVSGVPSCNPSSGCSPAGHRLKKRYNLINASSPAGLGCRTDYGDTDNADCGSSGFDGLLVGYRNTIGAFYNQGSLIYFWSSSVSSSNALARYLYSGYSTITRYSSGRTAGFSVRCLKD